MKDGNEGCGDICGSIGTLPAKRQPLEHEGGHDRRVAGILVEVVQDNSTRIFSSAKADAHELKGLGGGMRRERNCVDRLKKNVNKTQRARGFETTFGSSCRQELTQRYWPRI